MGKHSVLSVVVVILLLMVSPVRAADLSYDAVLDELNFLLEQKDYESAYQLAELYSEQHGGDSNFDLLLGFSAYGSKRYQEAVFAFERVAVLQPNNFNGRFFLAQSYGKLKNYAAAEHEVKKLQLGILSEKQALNLANLQRRIERNKLSRQRAWSHQVGVNLSYDSNVNSGTDQDTIEIPNFGEIALFDSARATSDSGYHLNYNGSYHHPLDQKRSIRANFSAEHFGYAEHSQFQRQQLGLNVAYQHKLSFATVSFSAFTRPLWLEQEVKSDSLDDLTTEPKREVALYRTETGIGGALSQTLKQKFAINAGSQISYMRNSVNPELDFIRFKITGGVQYRSRLFHAFNVHWYQDANSDDYGYNDRSVTGFMYLITIPINDKLSNTNYVMYESHGYDAAHPLFGVIREESLIAASSRLSYQYSKHQQFKLQLNVQQKDSNVELFNFDRFELSVGWQYRF